MKNAITLDTFLLWTMKHAVITKLLCLHPSKYIDFYYGPDCIFATYPVSEWASWEVLWWLHMLLSCSPNEQQFHENELSVYLNICATVQPLSSSAYVLYRALYLTMIVKLCIFIHCRASSMETNVPMRARDSTISKGNTILVLRQHKL